MNVPLPLYYVTYFLGYPKFLSDSVISSKTVGSSMVEGIRYSLPLEIARMVPLRILPERVFGRRATIEVSL